MRGSDAGDARRDTLPHDAAQPHPLTGPAPARLVGMRDIT